MSAERLGIKHNKRQSTKRQKRRRQLFIAEVGLLLALFALYFMISRYYQNHFYHNTLINGVDTSNLTIERAEAAIDEQVKAYRLTILGRNGITDTVYGDKIDLHTEYEGGLEDLLKQQNGFLWPKFLFKTQDLRIGTMLAYDDSLLQAYFSLFDNLKEENNVPPTDAFISEYGEGGYTILPENPGSKVKKEKLYEAISEAILTMEPELSIEEADCYEVPKRNASASELKAALDELNKLAGTRITYQFGDTTEILDGSRISEWLSMDESFHVTLDKDKVKEYVDYIGKTYNSFGRVRTFKTSYDKVIKVEGGDYGWWLDRKSELAELLELIEKGEQTVKTPVYFQTAQQYGDDDIGDTYVEINLTAQHLFFYKDGELIVESDFVSGNVSKNFATPVGTYPIQYKENDAVLVGEDYETPVKYWMPFNRNIGMHDASWRKEFGKNIYMTRGSHGCINMPPKAAKKVFENIKRGVAVVVYELPGTESYDVEKAKETIKKKAE
jgi:hypothetical protein